MKKEDFKEIEDYYGITIPEPVMDAFMGVAQSVWVYNRPVFDESLIPVDYVFPEMEYEPLIVTRMTIDELKSVDRDACWLYNHEEFDEACDGVTNEGQFIYEYNKVAEAYTRVETKFVDEEGNDVYDDSSNIEVPWDLEEAKEWIDVNDLREYSNHELGKPIIYVNLLDEYE